MARAVEETRGVVGTYQGSYAGCYYTASNGGQVATPNQIWGGDGDYGYIQQKDDPYDLENSRSMVNSLSVPAARDEGDFWKLLDERIDTSGHARVRGGEITEITLSDPAFEGSYMYRQMDVTMKIQTRDRGLVEVEYDGDRISGWAMGYAYLEGKWYKWDLLPWQDTEETRTVSLSVYEDVKDGFSLGLNSRDYEICSVRQEGENYLIEMRRFGHGVGMSQRGAQVMAGNYDMSYVEILNFYYPGMTLERIDWDTPELPAREEIPQALAKEMLNLPPAEGDLGNAGGRGILRPGGIAGQDPAERAHRTFDGISRGGAAVRRIPAGGMRPGERLGPGAGRGVYGICEDGLHSGGIGINKKRGGRQ